MDYGKYIDFGEKTPNKIWVIATQREEPKIRQVVLKHCLAGDSDSVYSKLPPEVTKNRSEDEITEIADLVGAMVNSEWPEFIMKAFNCPESRSDSILSNREVVASRAFFSTKKRYAMRVINDEGKKVDKIKVAGLQVKKSDTQKAVKDFLSLFLDRLLRDGIDRSETMEMVSDFKKSFMTLPIQEIGTPMPAKTLKKYETIYEETGSLHGFPYHVRGALFYNSQCSMMDKKIYPSEKFYICRIKHPESRYIALPMDSNTYPTFWDSIEIDYEAQWKKAKNVINAYLENLGWDFKTMALNKAKSIFGVES